MKISHKHPPRKWYTTLKETLTNLTLSRKQTKAQNDLTTQILHINPQYANNSKNTESLDVKSLFQTASSPYIIDMILPSTLNLPVELNVPMPIDDVGVNPVAFQRILLPADTVGELVLLASVVHVPPLLVE